MDNLNTMNMAGVESAEADETPMRGAYSTPFTLVDPMTNAASTSTNKRERARMPVTTYLSDGPSLPRCPSPQVAPQATSLEPAATSQAVAADTNDDEFEYWEEQPRQRIAPQIPDPPTEPKRMRVDPRNEEPINKEVSNHVDPMAAYCPLAVAVTCERTGYISQEVSDQIFIEIQRQIVSEAFSATKNETDRPSFNEKPRFTSGVLKLWCRNAYTLAWLKKAVSGLSYPGNSLVVISQRQLQKRRHCRIVIPDVQRLYQDTSILSKTLGYQNPWVDIEKWIFLSCERHRTSWIVELTIPEDHILILMGAQRRLSFGLGSVFLRFRSTEGKYVKVPGGWDLWRTIDGYGIDRNRSFEFP